MFWFHRNRKRGQITPFLIAVIAILLITTMITVNLGKVSMTRTNTANAADAGALAGASAMANGLNAIKDLSTMMFMETVTVQAILASCMLECSLALNVYTVHLALQISQIALAQLKMIPDTMDAADDSAKQLAFSNAGVDEAKPRNPGETYEAWLQRESSFEEWMDDEGFKSGLYAWNDTIKYGQPSTASPGLNSVRVRVDTPTWVVVPLPLPIWIQAWLCCGKLVCVPCCICVTVLPMIWGIAAVIGDTSPIELTVTRVEPDISLGLWQMRYHKEGQGGIISSAEAHAHGGMVLPFGPDYDSELTEAR